MTSPFEFHYRIVMLVFVFGVAYPNRSKLRGMRNPFLDQKILKELILIYGVASLVFIDEAGFEKFAPSVYGWSKRGERVYGEKQGKRGKKENLVAGRRKNKKELIAPMLFSGSLNTEGFEG
jgi:hypothetical protein